MKKYLFILLSFYCCVACQQQEAGFNAIPEKSFALAVADQIEVEPPRTAVPPPPPSDLPTPNQPEELFTQRQIIRTADYRIKVADVEESTANIKTLVRKYQGFMADMDLSTTHYEMTNRITVRVPNDQFDDLIAAIGTEALFTHHKKISAQDVTEEFVDLTVRLNAKKEVRDRYVHILRTKSKTVKEVLETEEKIRHLQEEIEAKEGRLRYLQEKISLSTIHLTIYQEMAIADAPIALQSTFSNDFKAGFVNGWQMILSVLIGLINIWPLLFLGGGIGYLIWRKAINNRRSLDLEQV